MLFEIIQSEEQKGKIMKTSKEHLRDLWDTIKNIYFMGFLEKKERNEQKTYIKK